MVEEGVVKDIITQDNSPFAMFQAAAASGSLDHLEKMLALQERWEANEARKAFVAAMAAFKADPPRIDKDKRVGYKQTSYSHASLGNVTDKISQSLSRHGLSAAWKTDQAGHEIKVTCTITHSLGHSESTSLSAPADTSGAKNGIQAIGSTITYLQRYTILALTGLATHDQDDDGASVSKPIQKIDDKHVSQIRDMINHLCINEEQFLGWIGSESVEDIPLSLYGKAMNALRAREAKKNDNPQ